MTVTPMHASTVEAFFKPKPLAKPLNVYKIGPKWPLLFSVSLAKQPIRSKSHLNKAKGFAWLLR